MGYRTFTRKEEYGPRKGLEGPFHYPNGQVLYYDPKEGMYWDPKTDFFVEHDDLARLQNSIFDVIRG